MATGGWWLPAKPLDTSGDSTRIGWMQRLDARSGLVGDLFPGGRDRVLAPHPCFEVRVPTKGGMSGGPVFTRRGLCGVFSSGDINDFPYGYASYIATCYYLAIDCDAGNGIQSLTITDLVTSGHIQARGDDFEMRNVDDRYRIEWS